MKYLSKKWIGPVVVNIVLLTGCGGGGGGSGSQTAGTSDTLSTASGGASFPLDSALSAYHSSAQVLTGTATDSATKDVYTYSMSMTPGGDGVFEGQAAKTATTSLIVKRNGVVEGSQSGTIWYQINPFKLLGSNHIDDSHPAATEYSVCSNQTVLTNTAKVGDKGTLCAATNYSDSNKATVRSTDTTTWELQADTATTANFCLKYSDDSSANQTECYRVDTAGKVVGYNIVMPVTDTLTLTFKK